MYYQSFEDLVVQALSPGGEKAFKKLYTYIYFYVYKRVYRQDIAEDIASHTLTKLWGAWKEGQLRNQSSLESWIIKVATHKATDYFRGKDRLHISLDAVGDPDESLIGEFLATVGSAEAVVLQREEETESSKRQYLVWRTLSEVSTYPCWCLVLRFMMGMKTQEVATICGYSKRHIERLIVQGKEEFKQIYARLIKEQQGREEGQ